MPMTKREYYDALVAAATDGTFPGGAPDKSGEFVCRYRGANGTRCAVGLLIPDDKYEELVEYDSLHTVVKRLLPEGPPEGLTVGNLGEIQSIHDLTASHGWTSLEFVCALNELPCFKEIINETPRQETWRDREPLL